MLQSLLPFAGARFGGSSFQLTLNGRFDVVLTFADLFEDTGLFYFTLKAFDGALNAFTIANGYFRQNTHLLRCLIGLSPAAEVELGLLKDDVNALLKYLLI